MRKQKNIIQVTPYFSPHIGGVEKVVEEISGKWTHGKSFILSGNKCQESSVYNKKIGETEIFFLPGFEIVDNFFLPAFWTKKFWIQLGEIKKNIKKFSQDFYIITHTRFFPTSFIGGLFAKKMKLKWIHIEHGSDYVKLSSPVKTKIAYIYDRFFGKWILKNADRVLCISEASKKFIEKEFLRTDVQVWYRGINFPEKIYDKDTEIVIVFIGRLVHLKGVSDILQAFISLKIKEKLIIIGDGEERKNLQLIAKKSAISNIEFLGQKEASFVQDFLSKYNCIVINPSYQEGLPTTVIEALINKNVVIATNVGGTKEISDKEDLLLISPGNLGELSDAIVLAKEKYFDLQGRSYEHVREKFDLEKSSENLYNFLD